MSLPTSRGRAFGALFRCGFAQALSEPFALLGRAAFFAVILLIFSRLWLVAVEKRAIATGAAGDLVWYLALTEWVTLSLPPLFLWIEEDVRTGNLACQLPRPVPYLGARLAEAAGDASSRLLVLGAAGAAFAFGLAGGPPSDPRGLWLALPLGLASVALSLVVMAMIGLFAFWLQDTSPLFWIWQKLTFVLGGLMFPLEIYPEWLRELALLTPFAALVYGPGSMAFGLDPDAALGVGVRLLCWSALAAGLCLWVYRRALRALDVNGG